jgi:hypothetical protein
VLYQPTKWTGLAAWRVAVILLAVSMSWFFGAGGIAEAQPVDRGYELVSPPDLGTHVEAVTGGGIDANPIAQTWNAVAADGAGVLWTLRTALPGTDDPTGLIDTYLSRRGTSQWTSTYVGPPGRQVAGEPLSLWASADLDHMIWQLFGATVDPTDQDPIDPNSPRVYADLYRSDPGRRFTRITQGSQAPAVARESPRLIGVSPDAQTVVFKTGRALEPGALPADNIYVRRNGTTTLVSKDENGVAVSGPNPYASSDDGNVVAFGVVNATTELYIHIRDRGLARTIHLHSANTPSSSLGFESLSADGRKLFLLSADPLTGDDADTSVDLYVYDTTTETLSRLSKLDGASGAGPGNTDVCGTPLPRAGQCDVSPVAVSRDGSKAYFVSPEQLDGTKGTDGAVNLYLAEQGTVRFVATLDGNDPDFGAVPSDPTGSPLGRHVRLTPDGEKLVFESRARLTGYDNADHVEIYLHDPVNRTVVCVSCRPDGTPPIGDASLRDGSGQGGANLQFSSVPMYPANADEHGEHIFFQSTDTIVPTDVNARYDVYQHDVATGAMDFISSGTSANDSVYLGNGVDGSDVFFFTTDTLVPQDRNGSLFKLYDARVGGGFPPPPPPSPPCAGAGCRGSIAPAPGAAQVGTGLVGIRQAGQKPGAKATPRSKLSVTGNRSVRGMSARLSAKVSGRGRLRVSGSGVVRTTITTKKAATYRVTVRLSRRAREMLSRTHRVSVKVTLRFVPSTGAARSTQVKMTFTKASKKGRG